MSNVIKGNFGYRTPKARKRRPQTIAERYAALRAAILADPDDGADLLRESVSEHFRVVRKVKAVSKQLKFARPDEHHRLTSKFESLLRKQGETAREYVHINSLRRLKIKGLLEHA
jgi:hypothetical protein